MVKFRGWLRALPNLTGERVPELTARNRSKPLDVDPLQRTEEEDAMNWDRVEGNWNQFKGKIQQQWAKLTDDDLQQVKGKRTELCGRLQQKYGYAKDQAEREVDDWLKRTP
jgi:uncharacterized protein YjbJ (UPF0337 family)